MKNKILFLPVYAVIERELIKTVRQRTRLLSAIARPLIWLFVIGAGIGSIVSQTYYENYQIFLIPGVIGMTILFGGLLAALTTVYDKESGVLRMIITAPLPYYWIVFAKMLSSSIVAIFQALILLVILFCVGLIDENLNFLLLPISLILVSLCCSGIGMVIASFSKTLDNFAGIMNFVIFPLFFLSGSIYPVKMLPNYLQFFAFINPYTYGVDLIRHSMSSVSKTDFNALTDILVLFSFIILSFIISSLRFSREASYGPFINFLGKKN